MDLMKNIAPFAIGAGTVLSTAGQLQQARAAREIAARQKTAADFEAAQLDVNAGEAIAAGQRAALEEQRRARLVASRALAVGAATGSASDGSVQHVIEDIEGEGAYRAALQVYQGEDRARNLTMGASEKRYEGDLMLRGGELTSRAYKESAIGTLIAGGGSLYAKYGMGGPKKNSLDDKRFN